MNDNGFIVLLAFGATLLAGILTVAHVSAYRLKQRLQLRRQADTGSVAEPELDLGDVTGFGVPGVNTPQTAVRIRHAETAR